MANAILTTHNSIKAGEDNLTRRKEFASLSQGQKSLMADVLNRLQLMSSDVQTSIAASEIVLTTRLDNLAVTLPATIRGSEAKLTAQLAAQTVSFNLAETRAMERFDVQDSILQHTVQQQDSQTTFLQDQNRDVLKTRLLDALAFPEMNDRRNMIERRVADFGETYRWMFYPARETGTNDSDLDDGDESDPSIEDIDSGADPDINEEEEGGTNRNDQGEEVDTTNDDTLSSVSSEAGTSHYQAPIFVEWLRNGEQLFWINGKPGSGKSTLMDYVYRELREGRAGHAHLNTWALPGSVRVLSFWFFRPASSILLKSMEGFWRSLCFQILDEDEELAGKIRNSRDGSAPATLVACLAKSGSSARGWTDTELQSWFTYLVAQSMHKYFILIDGLDELADQHATLLASLLDILFNSDSVKICCSSRSERQFQNTLRRYPSLRLQDFNNNDIKSHCHKRLAGTSAQQFAHRIVDRAEGVFLWAHVVTEDLKTASDNGDPIEDLNLRFEQLPTEMNDLFGSLLERQDRFYAKHPKPYLHLINTAIKADSSLPMQSKSLTLLELLLALQDQENLKSSFPDHLDALLEPLELLAADLEANMIVRCAGLVECADRSELWGRAKFSAAFPYEALSKAHEKRIHFVHRSAQDFLLETERGGAFLQTCGISDEDVFKRLLLARAIILIINKNDFLADEAHEAMLYDLVDPVMLNASQIDQTSWSQFETIVVDSVIETLVARWPTELPWERPLSAEQLYREEKEKASWMMHCQVLSPALTPFNNLLSMYIARYFLLAYLQAKLQSPDRESSSVFARFCQTCLSCVLIDRREWSRWSPEVTKVIKLLVPFVSWTEDTGLWYNWDGWDRSWCFGRRPLRQNVGFALVQQCYFRGWDQSDIQREQHVQRILNLFHTEPYGDGYETYVESFCVTMRGDTERAHMLNLSTEIENDLDADIFKICTTFTLGQQSAVNVQVFQWCPPGLSRFIDVGPTEGRNWQNHIFARRHTAYEDAPERGTIPATVLNDALVGFTPTEIASIVARSDLSYGLIFSKARFRAADLNERRSWEARLEEKAYEEDFDTKSENNRILVAIMEQLGAKWDEEEQAIRRWRERGREELTAHEVEIIRRARVNRTRALISGRTSGSGSVRITNIHGT